MGYNDGLMDGALPVWMVAESKTRDAIEAPEHQYSNFPQNM
jgi:hypothetical protein